MFGLPRNSRLCQRITKAMQKSRRRCAATKRPSRRFRQFRYRTLKSWSRKRHVVAKAEWRPGQRGDNLRFVVTSLPKNRFNAHRLYEDLYCARSEMENRMREQQLWLCAGRTSSAAMRANQLRLYFSTFADILVTILRRVGLRGTDLAKGARRHHPVPTAQACRVHQGDGAQGLAVLRIGVFVAGCL